MRYLDVCAGISASSQAWKDLGWECAGYSEIDKFPRAVLEQRHGATSVDWDHEYTESQNIIPLFGDFTKIEASHVGPIDLLVGGTPCQSFSIAGKRLGLDDPRGNLAIEFLALAKRLRSSWLVWENVAGVYSSWSGSPDDEATSEWTETADFAEFLNLFRECGYRGGWRTLDAQYVRVDGYERAVPQRRRRCILVGHLGDDARAISVLFDPESLHGIAAPRRATREGVAGSLGGDFDRNSKFRCAPAASTLNASFGSNQGLENQHVNQGCPLFIAEAVPFEAISIKDDPTPKAQNDLAFTLTVPSATGGGHPQIVCSTFQGRAASEQVAPTVNGWTLRKLTPRECERLQGFPDDFTAIQWRGKVAADGPRYKSIGNTMAVNVMRWIGERIALVEQAAETAGKIKS
ncbi:MAG: DNA cytosine methyltransferase [Sphingomonadales bacterium]|nr:DNA cytosine methyltransferase [Sphingomonadales bacterium]